MQTSKRLSALAIIFCTALSCAFYKHIKPQYLKASTFFKEQKADLSFIAVGDVSFSRGIESKFVHKLKDPDKMFEHLDYFLQSADFVFGNLETTLIEGPLIQTNQMVFRSFPYFAKILKNHNFKVLSLANNHIGDFGQEGLKSTFKNLKEQNLIGVGSGQNIQEAQKVKFVRKGKLILAFIAHTDQAFTPGGYAATNTQAGTTMMNIDLLEKQIKFAKKHADLTFVSMHSGIEYKIKPNSKQIEFAHAAINFGADMVIGHHPHVVQHFELYKEKPIIYSLGNFIFDQMWSENTKQGLAVKIKIKDKKIKNLEFYPTYNQTLGEPKLQLFQESNSAYRKLNHPLIYKNHLGVKTLNL